MLLAIPCNEDKAHKEALLRKWRTAPKGYEATVGSYAKPVSNATAVELPPELTSRFTCA